MLLLLCGKLCEGITMFWGASAMCSFGLTFATVFLATLRIVDGTKSGCPENVLRSPHFAKVHNRICYLFVNQERYWEDARRSCLNMGGEMLSVEDYQTMRFVRSTLNSRQLGWNKRGVWLGASYRDGRWRWASGKPLGYANWASGEPSKILGIFSVEDCALMRRGDNWRWHDYMCGSMQYHFNYICQFPVENSITTTTTTTTTTPTTTTTTTAATSATSSTTVATVFKPGYFSNKGPHVEGTGSKLNSHGSRQQEDKMGEETGVLDNRRNGTPNHPHDVEDGVPRYPYERRPGFNDRGYNEVHSTTQVLENGNLTILTIILVTGGIILLILLLIFLIVRKRYNYKKAVGQPPTVYFENRNYNHSHSASGHGAPLPPPPAPHTFHRPSAPPVPPRPLTSLTSRLPHPEPPTQSSPHLSTAYVPHSRPASDLYLTPVDIGAGTGIYEEVRAPKGTAAHTTSGLTSIAAASSATALGACRGMFPQDREDSATTPLISASGAPWGQSEESLHSMSGSLTMKTSSIHNDYVDMNGSPVVPARSGKEGEALPKLDVSREADSKGSDPKEELSRDDNGEGFVFHGEGKAPCYPGYSNLMTTSQERCENLYAQLH